MAPAAIQTSLLGMGVELGEVLLQPGAAGEAVDEFAHHDRREHEILRVAHELHRSRGGSLESRVRAGVEAQPQRQDSGSTCPNTATARSNALASALLQVPNR